MSSTRRSARRHGRIGRRRPASATPILQVCLDDPQRHVTHDCHEVGERQLVVDFEPGQVGRSGRGGAGQEQSVRLTDPTGVLDGDLWDLWDLCAELGSVVCRLDSTTRIIWLQVTPRVDRGQTYPKTSVATLDRTKKRPHHRRGRPLRSLSGQIAGRAVIPFAGGHRRPRWPCFSPGSRGLERSQRPTGRSRRSMGRDASARHLPRALRWVGLESLMVLLSKRCVRRGASRWMRGGERVSDTRCCVLEDGPLGLDHLGLVTVSADHHADRSRVEPVEVEPTQLVCLRADCAATMMQLDRGRLGR